MGDGDGWVQCAAGHRHWGRFGAAGLMLRDGSRTVLQHRAPWTHEGDTWGLPGGARDSHEDAVETALREAGEEAAIAAQDVEPIALWVDDHGGWSYTTVLARPRRPIHPHAANAESTDIRWWPDTDIPALPLHRGFAASWPQLHDYPPRLRIVLGDALGGLAPEALGALVTSLARHGVPGAALPAPLTSRLSALLPTVGLTSGTSPVASAGAGWWRDALAVPPAQAPSRGALRDITLLVTDDRASDDRGSDDRGNDDRGSDDRPRGDEFTALVAPAWLFEYAQR